ncbi:hypothetical protein AJ80_03247 [Polytolypa hystricis UAMH7299]|uniref:Transcription initiation factor TFIID subunit 4 n=1 Tax=Polytolypa hystricis (strain UAMH7299) TaxID=1447883 RepID=A0A2B7YIS1_POLH7|nr:hypothetical protein AJ80_03247 [Polytolypa hystricis UAMH7299]
MAQTQPQQPFAARPFSPPVSSPSPNAPSPLSGIAPPPTKRQRLSPLPQSQSPYASPSMGTISLTQTHAIHHPTNGLPVNGTGPAPMMNAPPPGSMGPPSRPVEKATDTAELTDVLASSGIDVREEEAFLTHGYSQTPTAPQPPRLQTNFTGSFASQPSPGTTSAGNSFSEQFPQKQSLPLGSFAPGTPGVESTLRTPSATPEDEKQRQDSAANRREQYHLQASFLVTSLLEHKLQKRTHELGIKLPSYGVFRPYPGRPTGLVEVSGPDGSSVVRSGKTLLTHDAPLGDIISLLSLACEERVRSVVDHSATLARNRKMNAQGVVPAEWSDLAEVSTPPREDTAQIRGTKSVSPKTIPQKRPMAGSNDASKPDSNPTVPNILVRKGRTLVLKEDEVEEERASKRARRNADAILGGDASRAGSVGGSTPGAVTPTGQAGDRAPEPERKTSKKDMKKAESKVTEAVQHQHAVETARMATNNLTSGLMFGGKKKTYSWLKSSTPTAPRSGLSTPLKASAAAPGSGTPGKGTGLPGAPTKPATKKPGEWREDDKLGAGIQIRDIVFMLEVDGRGLKHLQKAYSKESKEDVDKPSR